MTNVKMHHISKHLFVIFLLYYNSMLLKCAAQCPTTIQAPCECGSTRYEPVSIVCGGAPDLEAVLRAVGEPPTVIDSLVVADTPIGNLPAFAFSGLAVKRLVLRNNRLTAVHPEAFDQPIRETLMELEIRNNPLIGQVPSVGLTNLPALRSLVLANCGVDRLRNDAFLGYECRPVLRRLDLTGNGIVDVQEGAFNGLTALEELSLEKNQLDAVPSAALAPLGATLRDLSLGVNKITSLPSGSLPLAGLQSLSVEANLLESVDADAFMSTPNLLYLYLSANRFSKLEPQTFFNTPSLRVLAMSDNVRLDRLNANAFQYVPDLVRLELGACGIETVEVGAFQTIPNVQVVVLGGNRLTRVHQSMFQGLIKLVSLDLKDNQIAEIEQQAFVNLPAMKHLDLSNNRLSTLDANVFLGTFERTEPPTSRMLYLYDNAWRCDGRLAGLRDWLRANPEMIVDAPGRPQSRCAQPAALRGVPLRQPPAAGSSLAPGATLTPSPGAQVSTDVGEITLQVAGAKPNGGWGVAAVILGIILGIFLLSLILLMVVRYFVARNHKQRKREIDELRQFAASASTASGYPPSLYAAQTNAGSYPADSNFLSPPPDRNRLDRLSDRYGPMGVVNPAVDTFSDEGARVHVGGAYANGTNDDTRQGIAYRGVVSGTLSGRNPKYRVSHNENNVDEVTINEGYYNNIEATSTSNDRSAGNRRRHSNKPWYWWF